MLCSLQLAFQVCFCVNILSMRVQSKKKKNVKKVKEVTYFQVAMLIT